MAEAEMAGEPERSNSGADPLNDAERVISAFGGVRPMATRLGMAATTVQGWKSRGHIPENRRGAILDAANAEGIDLSPLAGAEDAAAPQDGVTPDAALSAGTGQRPRREGNSVAWLALVIAGLAGVAIATQPKWSPAIHGETPPGNSAALEQRIAALEGRPANPDVTRRIVAVENALSDLRAREPIAMPPDPTGRIVALEKALNALRAREPAAMPPDPTPRLDALSARLDELTRAFESARQEGRSANDLGAAAVAALREAVDELSAKIARFANLSAAKDTRGTALVLAIGALEDALRTGVPFAQAHATVARFAAAGDKNLADPIAVLAAHAGQGIPTRAQLGRRLSELVSARGAPLWSAEGDGWTDRLLRKIGSVISIRRVDDKSGDAARLVRAQSALAEGGLSAAAAELADAIGPGRQWAREARNRVAAERALASLRQRAIERLEAPVSPKAGTQ